MFTLLLNAFFEIDASFQSGSSLDAFEQTNTDETYKKSNSA